MARQISRLFSFQTLLLAGLSLLLLTACSGKSLKAAQATPTPIPMPVIAAKPIYQVQRGELVNRLKFSGRIAPIIKQELSFATSGRIDKVYVQRGDTVTEGQLLAEQETGQNEFDLQRAQANLKIAQLHLELARLQTPQSSEVYTITIAIQEQEVALAQIALDELNAAYNSVRITSPISGTIFSIAIADGNMTEANKPVIVVADLNELVVSADLMPDDMALLTVGMKVTVKPVGRSIPEVEGTIQNLPYPYGSADAEQTGNSVQVALDQSPVKLGYKAGDMVNLEIVLEKKTDALWLPTQAVREFEGRYFAIVQDGEWQRRVDIKTGIIEGDHIEIVEGLTEGQVVIAP